MTSIAIRRSLHHKYLCETVRYARSVPCGQPCSPARSNRLPDEISVVEPPDPIPNSEVKRNSADGSVGLPCESRSSSGFLSETPSRQAGGFFFSAFRLPPSAAARQAYRAWHHSRAEARRDSRGWEPAQAGRSWWTACRQGPDTGPAVERSTGCLPEGRCVRHGYIRAGRGGRRRLMPWESERRSRVPAPLHVRRTAIGLDCRCRSSRGPGVRMSRFNRVGGTTESGLPSANSPRHGKARSQATMPSYAMSEPGHCLDGSVIDRG